MTMDVRAAVERWAPAVVGLRRGARGGSGVVVAPDRVLVLAHRLRDEEVEVVLGTGATAPGRVVGTDPDLDIALLQVATGDVEPPAWAERAPVLGEPVIAMGDPGGAGLRATAGAVAARPLTLRGRRGRPIEGVVEHTAPLPRGAGGGPLLDADGGLLGVNALRGGGGLVLALPAAALRARVEALAAGDAPAGRRLGVAVLPAQAARRMRRAVGLEPRDGVLVRAVEDGSPAGTAGVARGDLVVGLAGRDVTSLDDLLAALDAAPAGEPVPLRVVRGAEERELEVAL